MRIIHLRLPVHVCIALWRLHESFKWSTYVPRNIYSLNLQRTEVENLSAFIVGYKHYIDIASRSI